MKKVGILLLALACVLGLAGCICSHSWVEADCFTPKTCPLCGRTEGQAIGHIWEEATCMAPRTCKLCGESQGGTVDHGWEEATCDAPRTCRWCALTEGDALGHVWEKATTEAPRTCSRCAATEGERIITDERFVTGENRQLFGRWTGETVLTGEMLHLESYLEQVPVAVSFVFGEDGAMKKQLSLKDPAGLLAELIRITEERLYAQFEEIDMDREEADELFADSYEMSISEYAAASWAEADLEGMLEVHGFQGVYYVSGDLLNTAANWTAEFRSGSFAVDGDRLTVTNPDGSTLTLTRAADKAE